MILEPVISTKARMRRVEKSLPQVTSTLDTCYLVSERFLRSTRFRAFRSK